MKHSVKTALGRLNIDWINKRTKRDAILLIQQYLSVAFNTVDINILRKDLNNIVLDGKVFKWFASYLKQRSYRVCINEARSDVVSLLTGVPRGTILGPILFLIYTVDLYYLLKSLGASFHFYADDTQIYYFCW